MRPAPSTHRNGGHDPRSVRNPRGLPRRVSPSEIKKAYRTLARELHPDVNPDAENAGALQGGHARLRRARATRKKREMYDLGGDPLSGAARRSGVRPGLLASPTSWTRSSGSRPASRGPRPRTRRGQDALIRISLELAEAAFGVTRELKVDTAVVCTVCAGAGTAPGTHPTGARPAAGRARSAMSSGRSSARCARCGRARPAVVSAR